MAALWWAFRGTDRRVLGRLEPLADTSASELARHDPLPPVVNDRYKASKIANFPKNEYWR